MDMVLFVNVSGEMVGIGYMMGIGYQMRIGCMMSVGYMVSVGNMTVEIMRIGTEGELFLVFP